MFKSPFQQILLCVLIIPLFAFTTDESVLILNAPNIEQLPRHFRTCQDPLPSDIKASLVGLRELHLSGSAQFSDLELKTLLKKLPAKESLIVVDLRAECHGFLNGIAVSWFIPRNWGTQGKSPAEIENEQASRLANLIKMKEVGITKMLSKNPDGSIKEFSQINVKPLTVSNEADLTCRYDLGYKRFYVMDHSSPSDDQVDEFVRFYHAQAKGKWLHIHCEAGIGRTTQFMCLCDMMQNAKKVSYENILERQGGFIGYDLTRVESSTDWKQPLFFQRVTFLKSFYRYAKENTDGFKTSWKQFKAGHDH